MKKISIIISIIILTLSLIPIQSKAAVPIDTAKIYSKGDTDWLLIRDGVRRYTYIAAYKIGDKEFPAYCMNRELPGVEAGTQTVNINQLITNVKVWRVLINGYPYKSISELGCQTEAEAYMATKQAVYCVLEGIDVNTYSAVDSDAGRRTLTALKKIVSNAQKSTAVKVSSELKINQENSLWKVDNKDNKYISQTFNVTANANFNEYSVQLENANIDGIKITDENNIEKKTFNAKQKFKILMPITKTNNDGNFIINVYGKVDTKPVLYGQSTVSGKQNYAMTGYTYEDGNGTKKIYYTKNTTKILIVKKDETEEKYLNGVEFDLLDENKNVLYAGLTTNQDGQIEINKLLPGTYYVKETRTIPGYTLYDELIKVELELNEKATVNVINSEEQPKIEKENKESEISVKKEESEIVTKNETNTSQNIIKNESIKQENKVTNETNITQNISKEDINIQQNKTQVQTNINQTTTQIKLPKTGM